MFGGILDMAFNNRVDMIKALKKSVIPYLREYGFKGSFPHFRRRNEEYIDLITFQFNRYGGSFVVELAFCPKEGVTMSWGEEVPPNKVTAHDINDRYRLKESKDEYETWFDYENAQCEEDLNLIALKVKSLLHVSDYNWIKNLFN